MPRTKTIEARNAYHTSHVLAPRQTNSIDIEPLGPPSRAEPAEYAWGLPERIDRMDPENSLQEATELAANRRGSAIAVWMDWNGGVWTNHYTDSKGWGTSEQIETGEGYVSSYTPPRLAIAPNGTAMLVWLEEQPPMSARRAKPDA